MTDYEKIKRSCLKRGELWEDPDFPATQSSVFYHQTPPFQFTWKRPKVSENSFDLFSLKKKKPSQITRKNNDGGYYSLEKNYKRCDVTGKIETAVKSSPVKRLSLA